MSVRVKKSVLQLLRTLSLGRRKKKTHTQTTNGNDSGDIRGAGVYKTKTNQNTTAVNTDLSKIMSMGLDEIITSSSEILSNDEQNTDNLESYNLEIKAYWKKFKRLGGKLNKPPKNAGHLSIIYNTLRPLMVKRIFKQLYWPLKNPFLQVTRTRWQGCALQWDSGKVDQKTILHSDMAIHIGGKTVNQDAIGICDGLLLFKDRKEPFSIIALADGVTTSLYSEFGALIAVANALKSGILFMEAGRIHNGIHLSPPRKEAFSECIIYNLNEVRNFMKFLRNMATDKLKAFATSPSESASDRAISEAEQHLIKLQEKKYELMATTLIVICATKKWFTAAGFGNGMIWVGFSNKDIAAAWQTDPNEGLEDYLSTHRTPAQATYNWTNSFEYPGIVTVGASTDGIANSSVLREGILKSNMDTTVLKLINNIINDQISKCPIDSVDNAALARIGLMDANKEI